MFDNLTSCPCHDKTRCRGDIECVFAVASRPNDVDSLDIAEIYGIATFEDGVAKTGQFIERD